MWQGTKVTDGYPEGSPERKRVICKYLGNGKKGYLIGKIHSCQWKCPTFGTIYKPKPTWVVKLKNSGDIVHVQEDGWCEYKPAFSWQKWD